MLAEVIVIRPKYVLCELQNSSSPQKTFQRHIGKCEGRIYVLQLLYIKLKYKIWIFKSVRCSQKHLKCLLVGKHMILQ